MRAFITYCQKEWQEQLATKKIIILSLVFICMGVMSVFIAKYMPDLIGSLVSEEMAEMMPKPGVEDVWIQFYKNIGQIGLVLTLIMYSSTLTGEYTKGTLILVLTKGLARWKVIVSKWFVLVSSFTVAYVLGTGVTLLYAFIYFKNEKVPHLMAGVFSLWLLGVLMLTLVIFMSSFLRTTTQILLGVLGIFVVAMVTSIFIKQPEWNPLYLSSGGQAVMLNEISLSTLNITFLISVISILVLLGLSIILFRKKQL